MKNLIIIVTLFSLNSFAEKLKPSDGCIPDKSLVLMCPNPFENEKLVDAKLTYNQIILENVNEKGMDEIDASKDPHAIKALKEVQKIRKEILSGRLPRTNSKMFSPGLENKGAGRVQ